MIYRAEKGGLLIFHPEQGETRLIPKEQLVGLEEVIAAGSGETGAWETDQDLRSLIAREPQALCAELRHIATAEPPNNAYTAPVLMNLELTTRCPLRCPQCYCDLHRGDDLPLEIGLDLIRQAARLKIPYINLSGGETLVYPHLLELIEACADAGISAAVALSGYGLDQQMLKNLMEAGVGEIYISLNGSTNEIHAVTRDRFDLSIHALSVLRSSQFTNYSVNWVAHGSNVEDFSNVAALCSEYRVKTLVVLAFKPDSEHSLKGAPSIEQLYGLAQSIRSHRGTPNIVVESCFSPLRAYLSQRFLGNWNRGISKGCGAGRDGISVDVQGNFTPCRHLDYREQFNSIEEYWYNSPVLNRLRSVEDLPRTPCAGCRFAPYCLHCMAINAKLNSEIYQGNETCEFWK